MGAGGLQVGLLMCHRRGGAVGAQAEAVGVARVRRLRVAGASTGAALPRREMLTVDIEDPQVGLKALIRQSEDGNEGGAMCCRHPPCYERYILRLA